MAYCVSRGSSVARWLCGHLLRVTNSHARRLCDPLPPVAAVLYYRWLAAGLHDKIISQGVGGHRVFVGICQICYILDAKSVWDPWSSIPG